MPKQPDERPAPGAELEDDETPTVTVQIPVEAKSEDRYALADLAIAFSTFGQQCLNILRMNAGAGPLTPEERGMVARPLRRFGRQAIETADRLHPESKDEP